jgi:hypothetical protein
MSLHNEMSGHYIVNGKIFYDKIEALVYANQNNIRADNIEWNFFNKIFYSYDWSKEPSDSLDELYKKRALQLREKYDYIVLFCSGGVDSTNMLYSFLKNGIKVDEVVASAPLSGLKKYKATHQDSTALNVISETFTAQIPLMEKVKSEYPDLKITINDYFNDILNYKEDDWLLKSSDWIHPTTNARYSLENQIHIKKLIEQGKKVAAIYGSNKPTVVIQNHNFISSIEDTGINVARPAFNDLPCNLEAFYTTPDMPEIVIKQSHCIAKYSCIPGNSFMIDLLKYKGTLRRTTSSTFNGEKWNNRIYEKAIVPAIYPSLEYNYFQADKPNYSIMSDMDYWFYEMMEEEKVGKMIVSDILNFKKSLKNEYFGNYEKVWLRRFMVAFPFNNLYNLLKGYGDV